jgi:hypothetical protein
MRPTCGMHHLRSADAVVSRISVRVHNSSRPFQNTCFRSRYVKPHTDTSPVDFNYCWLMFRASGGPSGRGDSGSWSRATRVGSRTHHMNLRQRLIEHSLQIAFLFRYTSSSARPTCFPLHHLLSLTCHYHFNSYLGGTDRYHPKT